MKVLVIGSGGREHALAWKLAQSPRVSEVLVAPGNAGTAHEDKCRNVDVAASDIDGLLALAEREGVAVTVVGPEGPLVAGVVDRFRAAGHAHLRPDRRRRAAGRQQGLRQGFPRPPRHPDRALRGAHRGRRRARRTCATKGAPIVIKADGLAAGKGVIVAMTLAEAEAAITDMLAGNAFGAAGARVVIEEFLDGEEASFISIVDGTHRAADGDLAGPQARRRRRHRPQHRRHGRVFAGAGGDARSARAGDARGRRSRPCTA